MTASVLSLCNLAAHPLAADCLHREHPNSKFLGAHWSSFRLRSPGLNARERVQAGYHVPASARPQGSEVT